MISRPFLTRELTKHCYLVTHAEWLSSIHIARCYNRDSGLYGGPVRWFNCVIEGRNEELFEERVSDQRSFYLTNAAGRRFKRNSCIIPAPVDVGECVASCRRSSVTRWRAVRAGQLQEMYSRSCAKPGSYKFRFQKLWQMKMRVVSYVVSVKLKQTLVLIL